MSQSYWFSYLVVACVAVVLVAWSSFAAASTSVIGMLLLLGLFAGGLALYFSAFGICLTLAGGLVVAGVAQLYLPQLQLVRWAIPVFAFSLGLLAVVRFLLQPMTPRQDLDAGAEPGVLGPVFALLAFWILTAALNYESLNQLIFGAKGYFQMWGLFFAVMCATSNNTAMHQLPRWFIAIALLQLPFVLHQYFVLVPIRTGIGGLVVAEDIVAGTFGGELDAGGANAVLSLFAVLAAALVLSIYRSGVTSGRITVLLGAVILLPLVLNANLVAVFYMAVAYFLLPRGKMPVHYRLLGTIAAAALFGAVLWGNTNLTTRADSDLSAVEYAERVIERNFGEGSGHGGFDLNRGTVLTHWVAQHSRVSDPALWLGHGLGESRESQNEFLAVRTLASQTYPGSGIGLTGVSALLWETGLVGTGLMFWLLFSLYRTATRLQRLFAADLWRSAMLHVARISAPIFLLSLFHKNFMVYHLPFQTLVIGILGYVAFVQLEYRRHPDQAKVSPSPPKEAARGTTPSKPLVY